MPRPKTIIIDDAVILAAIQAAYEADRAELARLEAAYAANRNCETSAALREFEYLHRWGDFIRSDLARFWGKQPTGSERIRLQECIRRLEAAGKVERSTIYIRPVQAPPPEVPHA